MLRAAASVVACLMIALWLFGSLFGSGQAQQTPQGQQAQAPMEVTTDTPEYCGKLLDRVRSLEQFASIQTPREVSDLSSQGEQMCAHGQTRGGIMRLRMAITLMMHEEKSSGP